jgi:uncharacterized protein
MTDSNKRAILSSLDPKRMELILYPTEQCNFRCTYCYEDFLLGKMSPETIQGIRRLISERIGNIRQLQLSWFGGEPLAAKDVIYEICEHARAECDLHGVHLGGNLTTNGYFLDTETASRLHKLGQDTYQISLDGYGADHDRTRKLMSGGGTFARIWSNLLALRDSDIPFHIMFRIHLTTDNLVSIENLAHEMQREFLHDKRFSVFLKTIENLGSDANHAFTIPQAERDAIYRRMSDAFGFAQAGSAETDFTKSAAPKICYAARPNSLAIRANGVIQKCTVQMSDEQNHLGTIRQDGSMDLDRAKIAYWMRGYDSMDLGELKCPAHRPATLPRKTIPIAVVNSD